MNGDVFSGCEYKWEAELSRILSYRRSQQGAGILLLSTQMKGWIRRQPVSIDANSREEVWVYRKNQLLKWVPLIETKDLHSSGSHLPPPFTSPAVLLVHFLLRSEGSIPDRSLGKTIGNSLPKAIGAAKYWIAIALRGPSNISISCGCIIHRLSASPNALQLKETFLKGFFQRKKYTRPHQKALKTLLRAKVGRFHP